MTFSSIALFLFLTFSFGLGVTLFLKNAKNFLERNIMRIGIGIGTIPIFGIVLNLFKIPLDWKILLGISFVCVLFGMFKWKKDGFKFQKINLTKPTLYIGIVMVLFSVLFFVMCKGSFIYPWFENGDPYDHAVSANYIAYQKTFSKPEGLYIAHYTEPYVQGFPVFMGLVRQFSDSIVWTLKFYNALLVALSIPFFYFFVKRFTQNLNIALFSTFALTAVPCFQSHFIFAESLALMLFFPAFYCIEMMKEDLKWGCPAVIITASIMVSQQLSAFNFGIFFIIYFICHSLFWIASPREQREQDKKRITCILLVGILGLALSCTFFIPAFTKYSLNEIKYQYTVAEEIDPAHKEFWKYSDTQSISYYTIKDFIISPLANKTDNPTGFGWVLFTLMLIGLFYHVTSLKKIKQNKPLLIALFWMLFSFLMVMGDRLPFRILPNRNWAFLSISAVIFAAVGWLVLCNIRFKLKYLKYAILGALLVGIILTSFKPKVLINTSQWAPHVFEGREEAAGYLWIKDNLPKNSLIFDFCGKDYKIMASDMMSPVWNKRIYELRYSADQTKYGWDERMFEHMNDTANSFMMNSTPEELHGSLARLNIKYIVISSECVRKFGENATNQRLAELSPQFGSVLRSQGMFIFLV